MSNGISKQVIQTGTGGGGGTIITKDEGALLSSTTNTLNFTGAGISASESSGTTTVNVPGTTPGGSNTEVQFNDSGSMGGDAGLTYNKAENTLQVRGKYEVIDNLAIPAVLTNPTVQATNDINAYTQISMQNKSAGESSSADIIAYSDNVSASDITGFADMGMTSSGFADPLYAVTGPNEAYLFASAPTGSGNTGNWIIATDSTGTENNIRFFTNGFDDIGNERLRITDTAITAYENISAPNLSGTNTGDQVISDATISLTDITTNNTSTTKHGFAPKLNNNASTFLDGQGNWTTPAGSGGEANTASNVGTAGVGVFKQKNGVDLEFKKINSGSSKVTITDDTGSNEVDIDIVEANINRGSLTGTQVSTTISDFTEASQDAVGAMVDSTLTYNDATPSLGVTANTTVQKIEVVKNSGAVVGTRKQLNFVEGTNVTMTIADDAGNDQVDITINASGGSGVTDGDKGDITVSSGGATWTIDNGVVSLAKQADVATSTVFYRKTAGTGSPEVQTLATLKTDLGLTGTNSGDQSIFSTIAVSGQSNVVADTTSDTLTFVAGANMTITTDASTDTVTFAASGSGGGLTYPQVLAITSLRI